MGIRIQMPLMNNDMAFAAARFEAAVEGQSRTSARATPRPAHG